MEQMMLDFFKVKEGDIVVYQGDRMTVRKCSAEWFSAVKEKDKSALIFRYEELENRVFKEWLDVFRCLPIEKDKTRIGRNTKET